MLDFVDVIRDPIYGLIPITKIELDVTRTKRMHRVRRIKQLGLVNLTYPSANHSRFEHSIGVMHLTSVILDEFRRRHQARISDSQQQTIRLAALLHDVGHGPFSHTFEEVGVADFQFDHEKATQRVLNRDKEIGRILGRRTNALIRFLDGGSIGSIPGEVVTGDVGSDRLDYLIRDTYFTGLGHRPDIPSIISSMRLVRHHRTSRVAIPPDELSGVELLATARYHHFAMIAYRKECRIREFLLVKAISEYLRQIPVPERSKFLNTLSNLDDETLIYTLKSKGSNEFLEKLDDPHGLDVMYRIRLSEVRSYVAKYCLYRLFYLPRGARDYCRHTSRRLSKELSLNSNENVFVDLELWKHQVIDLISYRMQSPTDTQRFSALVNDESPLLPNIAGAQVQSSSLSVYGDLRSHSRRALILGDIEQKRGLLLADREIVPFTSELLRKYGLCKADHVLILLHSLNDFYSELVSANLISDPNPLPVIPYFRGITRLIQIVEVCKRRLGIPDVKIEKFGSPAELTSFVSSPELFTILNAFHHLGFIELLYEPERNPETGRFAKVYFLRIREKKIRRSLFGRKRIFRTLRRQYLNTFREPTLVETFERFYANDQRKVIGGPSSRAKSTLARHSLSGRELN